MGYLGISTTSSVMQLNIVLYKQTF